MNSPSFPPVISVIIPIYKVENYIVECLASVVSQDVPCEILLVDDCGGDKSVQYAQDYLNHVDLASHQWRVLTHEKNRGLSAARNTGILAARGEYLYFLDSDDYLLDRALSGMLELAQQHHADITIANMQIDIKHELDHKLDDGSYHDGEQAQWSYWTHRWFPMACNKLIRREFVEKNDLLFVDSVLHEDEIWSVHCAFCKPRLAATTKRTYYYRLLREGSIMSGAQKLESYAYALMTVLWHSTQLGLEHGAMSNRLYREFLQDWQMELLMIIPRRARLSWRQRQLYYRRLIQEFHPALRLPYEGRRDWHFSVVAKLCQSSGLLHVLLLRLFLLLWEMQPGSRLRYRLDKIKEL